MNTGIAVHILQGFYYNLFQCSLLSLTSSGTYSQLQPEEAHPFCPWLTSEAERVLTFPELLLPRVTLTALTLGCTFRQPQGLVSGYWNTCSVHGGSQHPAPGTQHLLSSSCYATVVSLLRQLCRTSAGMTVFGSSLFYLLGTAFCYFQTFKKI